MHLDGREVSRGDFIQEGLQEACNYDVAVYIKIFGVIVAHACQKSCQR